MSVSNLKALAANHTLAISSLSVAHASILADLSEPEHAHGDHRRLQARLEQNEAVAAANRFQLSDTRRSLAIVLRHEVEHRSDALTAAQKRYDAARADVAAAGGSLAHRKRLAETAARADDRLLVERKLLSDKQRELAALAVE